MKVVIFGATGPAGIETVKEALARKYEVVALVRNPDKLKALANNNLKVHQIDVCKDEDILPHLEGTDAVLSCLGGNASFLGRTPVTIYTESMKAITSAMKRTTVKRIICITSWATVSDPTVPFVIDWILRPLMLRSGLANMADMESYLQSECNELDYTVLRPPHLTHRAATGREMRTNEGQTVVGGEMRLPRRDLAKYMLDIIPDKWKKKIVAISL